MKFLKDSKSLKTKIRKSSAMSIKELGEILLTNAYDFNEYETHTFPHGDLRIAKKELGYFLGFMPLEIVQYDDGEFDEKRNDVLWLMDMKKQYPSYHTFYYQLIDYFKDNNDVEAWCTTMIEMKEHCPQTPMSLYEEMYYNEQNEGKTREQMMMMYGAKTKDLHAVYPSRKCFYLEEVVDILGFYVNNAIFDKKYDVAQQYIDKVSEIIGIEPHMITENWKLKIVQAKTPRWKKILYPIFFISLILGIIGFILWLIYKAGAWIWSLF